MRCAITGPVEAQKTDPAVAEENKLGTYTDRVKVADRANLWLEFIGVIAIFPRYTSVTFDPSQGRASLLCILFSAIFQQFYETRGDAQAPDFSAA